MPKYNQQDPRPTYSPANQGPILPQFVHDYMSYGAQKGDRNTTLFNVAAQYRDAGIFEVDITPQLIARATVDGLSASEAQKTISSAFAGARRDPLGSRVPHPVPPPAWRGFFQASPQKKFTPPPPGPASLPLPTPLSNGSKVLLEICFRPGENVSISGTQVDPDGKRSPMRGDVYSREHWLSQIAVKPIGKYYPGDGIYIRINPMLPNGSHEHEVACYRHGLFEADKDGAGNPIPKEEQYAALIGSGLPCSVITDSGNVSVHALVRLDARDKAEFERRYSLAMEALAGHWIDPNTGQASRYSRFPGVDRKNYDDQGNYTYTGRQELLAINVGEATWEEWEAKYCKDPLETEIERVMRFRKVSELSQVRPTQLVEGLLYRGTKMMFVAPSKSFKTWNLLHFFFCVTNGIPYMGRVTIKTPVVYIDFELLEFDLWWRLSRIAAAYGLPGDPFANFHVVSLGGELLFGEQEINFAHPKVREFLVREINRTGAGLFGIDPIYMTYCGGDENSNSGDILSKFDPICRQTGAAFIYNHHFAKGDPTGKNPFDRASGAGLFLRNVYTGVAFTPHQVADAFTVNFTVRGFAAIAPYVVRWQMPLLLPDSSLDPDDLAITKTGVKRTSNAQDKILAALYGAERNGGLATLELAHVAGVSERTVQRHLKALIAKDEAMLSIISKGYYQLSLKNSTIWSRFTPQNP